MSKHAEQRCKQRHISGLAVDLLRRYGTAVRAPGGARIRILTRRQRKRLLNDLKHLEKNLSADDPPYLIEDEGEVITTGRRTKRIKR